MHVFLTGGTRVGKSTVVRRFLVRSGLSADGFMTYWEVDADGGRSLYLAPYRKMGDAPLAGGDPNRRLLARRHGGGLERVDGLTDVFDSYGARILDGCGHRDVIVMDELGFLESQAGVFQAAVMRHVDGGVPIVGVMRSAKTEFLDVLRCHPAIEVREVTAKSRDAVVEWLASRTWT